MTTDRYSQKQRAMFREMAEAKRTAGLTYHTGRAVTTDAERLLAEVPEDTRGLTATLMGDPLPSRSALDRRTSHQSE